MSNWRLSLKRLFQTLCRSFVRLFRRRSRNPRQQLSQICEALEQQLSVNPAQAWTTYLKAIALAQRCDHAQLAQVIARFDTHLNSYPVDSKLEIGQAISFLLARSPQTAQALNAAWQLTPRLTDTESIRGTQQQICQQMAQLGDSDALLSKLLKRRNEDILNLEELTQIVQRFLMNHSFQPAAPWKAFFAQYPPSQLPRIHQVYAVLDRSIEASELAESAQDYHSAIRYLVPLSGEPIASRRLALAQQLGDGTEIAQAHQNLAETYWKAQNYREALKHFQQGGILDRASDCHQQLGELDRAIQLRPLINSPDSFRQR